MNQHTKKPLIIAAVVFTALFVLLLVITLTINRDNESVTQEEVAGTVEIDPVSGEEIATGSHQSQTDAGSPNSDQATMLGFGKLADYGMAVDQRAAVQAQLNAFAKIQDPAIKLFSFYKDSYRQQLPDEDGVAHMTFMVQADRTTDYYVDVAYSGTSAASVSIYKDDKKTLLFSE